MAKSQSDTVLRHLRAVLLAKSCEHLTDADLMRRFVGRRDEAAFAMLVRRHSGLVLKVCRHVLHGEAEADDAFQATFMVLVRKIASIQKQTSLVSWLHRVAFRCAMDVRKRAMRRRKHEEKFTDNRVAECPVLSAALNELQAFLDDEIQRLAEKYRAPFLLCCLEGKSRADAAQALGWNEGTLASRLAKAREILQKRLMARGISVSAALAAATVSPPTLTAQVSPSLMNRTVDAALAFAAGNAAAVVSSQVLDIAQGVLNGMFLTKLKLGLLLVCATSLTILATGALVAQPDAEKDPKNDVVPRLLDDVAANGQIEPKQEPILRRDAEGNAQAPKDGVEVTAQIAILKKPSLNDATKQNAADDFVATSIAIIASEKIAERAIDKHKLKALKSLTESTDPAQDIVRSLSVARDPKSAANVINLSYVASDAKDGVAILNAVIDSFQDFVEMRHMLNGKETFELVRHAREVLSKDMHEIREKLAQFRREIPNAGDGQKNRISTVTAKIDEVQIKLNEIEGRLAWIEMAKERGNRIPLLLKANEWAVRSGYDKLKDTDGDTIAAYTESFKADREELQLVMRSLTTTLKVAHGTFTQQEEFKLEEKELRSEAQRTQKFLEIIEVQLKQIDLTRSEGGYSVWVIRPAAHRAPRPAGS